MSKFGRRSVWIVAGIGILVVLAMIPSLLGTAGLTKASSAATDTSSPPCVTTSTHPVLDVSSSSDTQYAYGGQSYLNFSFSYDGFEVTYNSSFGWTVTITVTQTSYGNWTVEEQRTVAVTILKNVTTPKKSFLYCFHAQEEDLAFANITNQSTVYVNDQPVPALGIVNASVAVNGQVRQTLNLTNSTGTYHASLNASAVANASVAFSPSLGLVPLNLTGVCEWNSSATASYGAAWNFSVAFAEFNGTTGSFSKAGSLSGTVMVYVVGHKFSPWHLFSDDQARVGVALFVQGPFNSYDGFILIPKSFDLFGATSQPYDSYGSGWAGISSENLYVSPGPGGLAITAADETFFSADSVGFAPVVGGPASSPAGFSAPGTTVYGQPMTVAQAQTIDHDITSGTGLSAGSAPGGDSTSGSGGSLGSKTAASALPLAIVLAAVAAMGGTVAVLAARSYARRP